MCGMVQFMAVSTSYRITQETRAALARQAEEEGVSATALLERYIVEGIAASAYPGIVFRGPVTGRRAGVAGGPDVWEIVARLRELDGTEEARIRTLAEESTLRPATIRTALRYAADHPEEITGMIERREAAIEQSRRAVAARRELLA